jgi:hypothetical protein
MGESMDEALEEWIKSAEAYRSLLEGMLLEGIELDNSVGSMRALQERLLRFDSGDDSSDMIYDGVADYIGEALLLLTGGSWGWDEDEERPIVRAEARLGLEPVSPMELMDAVMARRDPEALVGAFESWSAAAERQRAADPSWAPITVWL